MLPTSPTSRMASCLPAPCSGSECLMNALFEAGPLLFPQHVLLDLPGRGLGQLAELHLVGTFVVSQALPAELDDLRLVGASLRFQGHEGLGALAPGVVWNRDHRTLQHSRVPGEGLFHLDGRYILAPRNDDVLFSVPELDVDVGVPDSEDA